MICPTPFFSDRGCHVRILEEARALKRLGYRTTICTYHLGQDVEGETIRRSLFIPWYKRVAAGPSFHKLYIDFLLLCTVLRVCFTDRPALIHGHLHEGAVLGWIAGLIRRVPVVADLQGSLTGEIIQHNFIKPGGILFGLSRFLERQILRLPSHLILSSDRVTQGLCELSELKRPWTIVQDGVDAERFKPAAHDERLREKYGLPLDRKLVGYIGVLNEYQGVGVMLRAFARAVDQVPDLHLLVMGYPNIDRYRSQADELGIADKVTFTDRLPYSLARDYLAACDITFSAKQYVTEANGKLLNYMAVGVPTVATDTPVNRLLLGESAVYGRVDDEISLADALVKLATDEILANQIGQAARCRVVDHLSWQEGGRRLDQLYRSLI